MQTPPGRVPAERALKVDLSAEIIAIANEPQLWDNKLGFTNTSRTPYIQK